MLSEMRSDLQEQVPVPAPPPAPNPATAVKASKGRCWVDLLAFCVLLYFMTSVILANLDY